MTITHVVMPHAFLGPSTFKSDRPHIKTQMSSFDSQCRRSALPLKTWILVFRRDFIWLHHKAWHVGS